MDATLNIAIAAEFELSEKIVERLEQSALEISSVSIVEITPFEEEQNIRFAIKALNNFRQMKLNGLILIMSFLQENLSKLPILRK